MTVLDPCSHGELSPDRAGAYKLGVNGHRSIDRGDEYVISDRVHCVLGTVKLNGSWFGDDHLNRIHLGDFGTSQARCMDPTAEGFQHRGE